MRRTNTNTNTRTSKPGFEVTKHGATMESVSCVDNPIVTIHATAWTRTHGTCQYVGNTTLSQLVTDSVNDRFCFAGVVCVIVPDTAGADAVPTSLYLPHHKQHRLR